MGQSPRPKSLPSSWPLRPLAAAIVAAGALGSSQARAASLVVGTLAETSASACTLRDAVDSINAGSDQGACAASGAYGSADTVAFAPGLTGTLTFFSEDPLSLGSALRVARSMAIQGPGSNALTLTCGSTVFRMMEIDAGVSSASASGLTIANCTPASLDGAGILVNAQSLNVAMSVQFTDVTLTGNRGRRGGALAILGGPAGATVTLTACNVDSNIAASGGGLAIVDNGAGPGTAVTVTESVISSNGSGFGGGAFVLGTSAHVAFTRATLDGNSAGSGGGIDIENGADATLLDSTASNNRATATGGGARVFGHGSRFSAINATLSGNAAGRGGGVDALALDSAGALSLASTTVANNRALFGGGVMVENSITSTLATGATIVSIVDTIVAGDTAPSDVATLNELPPVPWSVSYSVIGASDSVPLTGTGNVTDGAVPPPFGASGWLGALQANGGPTLTHALLTGVADPAIDAGDPAFFGLAFDQRGPPFRRVENGRIDVGAYEVQSPRSPSAIPGPRGLALALLSALLGWLGWRLRPRR